MQGNMLVSVIIPVFDVESFLEESIESVIHQTYKKLEIIVVDDGSTDDSGKICDEFARKDNRIHVIHQENKGLSGARNTGLNAVTGEAVAFLDSDDAYDPYFIQLMLNHMCQEKTDLVVCKFTVHETTTRFHRNGREKTKPAISQGRYSREDALRALADGIIDPDAWNKLYRSFLWKTIRFPEGHVFEDIDTTYKIMNLCNIISVIDEPLYMHRKRPGSITDTCSRSNINDWLLARFHFEAFIHKNVPDVFTFEQLNAKIKARLVQMIVYYMRFARRKHTQKDRIFIRQFREQIIKTKNEVGIDNCGLRIKTSYLVIRFCPWLMTIVSLIYYSTRFAWSKLYP